MLYSRVERVMSAQHHFASKSSAAVRETLSKAHPETEVPDKNFGTREVLMGIYENLVGIFSVCCKGLLFGSSQQPKTKQKLLCLIPSSKLTGLRVTGSRLERKHCPVSDL
jgi:hypothetical protein